MILWDRVYRSMLLNKLFSKGWGNPEHLKRIFDIKSKLSDRELCQTLVNPKHPIKINKQYSNSEMNFIEGSFETPLMELLPEVIPEEVKTAHFQLITPIEFHKQELQQICIHLAGTGDHSTGIGAIILENPFYGLRKPKEQTLSSLNYVSDVFVMGGCLILECMVLLHWCKQQGYGLLGLTGISLGGFMASLAATNWPYPIVLVPCLSWSTAASVFTSGVMSNAVNWNILQEQLNSDDVFQYVLQYSDGVAFEKFRTVVKESSTAHAEAYSFMNEIMNSFTNLRNFSIPVDTDLVISVAAINDAYIPKDIESLQSLWPDAKIRYLKSSHVGAIIRHMSVFRKAIQDAFSKAIHKY